MDISIDILSLIGGGPHGTLIGHMMYLVQTNNNADVVSPEDHNTINQLNVTKVLEVWISEDMSWSKNTTEVCKKGYSRLTMLTKLKYVGP